MSQFVNVRFLDGFVMAHVLFRDNPSFKRKPSGERTEYHEVGRFHHDAVPGLRFFTDHVAVDAPTAPTEKVFGTAHLFLNLNGDHRRHNQLRMAMLQRGPGKVSFVFEDQRMNQAAITFQIHQPIVVHPQDFTNLLGGKRSETGFVVRAIEDHFVSPDSLHDVIHADAPAFEFAFDLQSRKLVRHCANSPPRSVWDRTMIAIRDDLCCRGRFISFAERTKRFGGPSG